MAFGTAVALCAAVILGTAGAIAVARQMSVAWITRLTVGRALAGSCGRAVTALGRVVPGTVDPIRPALVLAPVPGLRTITAVGRPDPA